MILAILSDIHGNIFALKEVLDKALELKVDRLLILGDCIGYYHYPKKVMQLLRNWDYELIRGNHEVILENWLSSNSSYRNDIIDKYGLGHQVAAAKLTTETIQELTSAPSSKRIFVDNLTIEMHHGSPRNPDEYIYPDTQEELLISFCNQEIDYLLMGHTHYPMKFSFERCTIINPGSVGQSRVEGGIANWGIIDTKESSYFTMRTPYDVSPLIAELADMKRSPSYLTSILLRKPSLT